MMAIDDDYVSIVPIGGFGPLNVVNTMLDLKLLLRTTILLKKY